MSLGTISYYRQNGHVPSLNCFNVFYILRGFTVIRGVLDIVGGIAIYREWVALVIMFRNATAVRPDFGRVVRDFGGHQANDTSCVTQFVGMGA